MGFWFPMSSFFLCHPALKRRKILLRLANGILGQEPNGILGQEPIESSIYQFITSWGILLFRQAGAITCLFSSVTSNKLAGCHLPIPISLIIYKHACTNQYMLVCCCMCMLKSLNSSVLHCFLNVPKVEF